MEHKFLYIIMQVNVQCIYVYKVVFMQILQSVVMHLKCLLDPSELYTSSG